MARGWHADGRHIPADTRGQVLDAAWPAVLWWSPPPESNRRPRPYHRWSARSGDNAAPRSALWNYRWLALSTIEKWGAARRYAARLLANHWHAARSDAQWWPEGCSRSWCGNGRNRSSSWSELLGLRSDSNRQPSDYESESLRPACAAQTRSGCSCRRGRPASAFLTCRVTAGGMTKRMTRLTHEGSPDHSDLPIVIGRQQLHRTLNHRA